MACPSAAWKSGSSHLFGVGLIRLYVKFGQSAAHGPTYALRAITVSR